MASQQDIDKIRNADPDLVARAESLILRGKAGAVRGDPELQPIVNALSNLGVQSVESQRAKAEGLTRIESQRQAENTVFVDGKGFSVRPEDQQAFIQEQIARGKSVQFQEDGETRIIQSGIVPPEEAIERLEERAEEQRTQKEIKEQTKQDFIDQGFTPREAEVIVKQSTKDQQTPTIERAKDILEQEKWRKEGKFIEEKSKILEVPPEPKGFLEKARAKVSFERGRVGATPTGLFLTGVGAGVLGIAEFGKGVVIDPIGTAKGTVRSIVEIPSKGAEIGMVLKQQPTFALGFVATQAAAFKGVSVGISKLNIPTRTGVLFKGVTQDVSRGIVRTELIFKTTKGGTGRVQTASGITDIGGKLSLVDTTAVGSIGTKVAKFPTGEGAIVRTKTFIGASKGVSRRFPSDINLQVSLGGVKEVGRGQARSFIDVSIGQTKGDLTAIGGVGRTSLRERLFSVGTLRNIKSPDKIVDVGGGSGVSSLSEQAIKSAALSQTQAIAKAGVSITSPKVTIKTPTIVGISRAEQSIKSPTFQSIKQPTKQIQTLTQIQTPTTKQRSIQTPKLISGLQTQQKQKITPLQNLKLGQEQISKSKLGSASLISVSQAQPQRLRSLQVLSLGQPQRGLASVPIFITPKTPLIPPSFKIKQPTQPKITGLFGVQVRRRGRFKTIGRARSISQAISIGAGRVGRTLAATFRVVPIGKQKISGVRTPTGFREGRTPLTFIERRGKRLSTRGEVREIKLAKIKL